MARKFSALCGVLLFLNISPAQALVFSDTEFLDSDWSITTVFSNNGATNTAAQAVGGGNGGAYRHMTHFMPSGPGNTSLFLFHRYASGIYDPGASGAIATIDYSEDQLQLAQPFPGAAIGARLAIEQGGVVYAGPGMTYNHTGAGN